MTVNSFGIHSDLVATIISPKLCSSLILPGRDSETFINNMYVYSHQVGIGHCWWWWWRDRQGRDRDSGWDLTGTTPQFTLWRKQTDGPGLVVRLPTDPQRKGLLLFFPIIITCSPPTCQPQTAHVASGGHWLGGQVVLGVAGMPACLLPPFRRSQFVCVA